jgi:hypothetical protein
MYSIVIPHLSNSKYIDTCIKYIKENSKYDPEIIQIIDETDVYYAFNKGVYQAKYDIVVLLSDDMIVSKNWDEVFPMYLAEDTFLTMNVVEPYPGKMNGPECIEYDCGDNLENFDYDKFQNYVDVNKAYVPEIEFNKIGWYMPFVVHKKSFVSYPNIDKFPLYANDVTLFHSVLPNLGYKFALVNSFVYHFQRKSTKQLYSENIMKKRAIFTYSNHQIEDKISYLQKQMIGKFNKNKLCKYEYLHYKKPDGEMTPDQVIEYGLEKFCNKLRKLGLKSLRKSASHYGLSVILGGAEASLWNLCGIYASLARDLNEFAPNNGQYNSDRASEPIYGQKLNLSSSGNKTKLFNKNSVLLREK